jgi:quinol monooxygenase YgiN
MIVIAGTIHLRPGTRADALRVARVMETATRAEPGCRQYRFYADADDPDVLFLFEEWDSDDALARHFQTAHMHEFQTHIPNLVAGPPTLKRYEVSTATPMG